MSSIRYSLSLASAAFALASCGVFGLSTEDTERLAFLKESSTLYYDTQRYERALELVDRGLELAPDDYKLLSIQAWCYLQQVEAKPSLLPHCERLFEELFAMRDPSEHGEPALLGQGETQKRLARAHLETANNLRKEADRAARGEHERAVRDAEASGHEERSRYHYARASRAFQALIDNEMNLRDANKHLMDIAYMRGDYTAAVEHGMACLEHLRDNKQFWVARIKETMEVREEHEARKRYQRLDTQELRVRSMLAQMHYDENAYDAALVQLDELLKMDPTRSNDYYNRARVHESLQQEDAARRDYQKFLSSTKLPVGDEKVTRAFQFTQSKRKTPGRSSASFGR